MCRTAQQAASDRIVLEHLHIEGYRGNRIFTNLKPRNIALKTDKHSRFENVFRDADFSRTWV